MPLRIGNHYLTGRITNWSVINFVFFVISHTKFEASNSTWLNGKPQFKKTYVIFLEILRLQMNLDNTFENKSVEWGFSEQTRHWTDAGLFSECIQISEVSLWALTLKLLLNYNGSKQLMINYRKWFSIELLDS